MSSPSVSLSSGTTWGTLVTSVDLDDEPTKSLDFSPWELAKLESGVAHSDANAEEFIALSDNCFIRNPSYHSHPVYRVIPPTHPQLDIFEHDAATLTNKLAQNPLVISTAIVCMHYPRPLGMWGFGQKHPHIEPPPFPVLCLSINNEKFLGDALHQISIPIHLDISSHPIQLLVKTPPGCHALGPLFPGDMIVGEGGQGTFGAYLYPVDQSQGEKNVVWGLTCGHVASSHEVTAHLRKGLYSPSIHDIQALSNETYKEYKKRRTEAIAEIDVSQNNQPLYSHSIQMINSILSNEIYNNFDIRQVKLETCRNEAFDSATKAICDRRLNKLEEHRRRRKELEQVKGNPSLTRVATVYCGEFGYMPESPALLPAATSDPGFPSQQMELLKSSCSEPTVAELRVKPMISTDWLLVKVERAAEIGPPQWMSTPGDIVPGLNITFMSGNYNVNNGLNPQRKGTINGLKAYISDCGVVTSEWAVYPKIFGSGFAEPGDSGGVIIDSQDDPVGLIFAGNRAGSYTFIKPLKFVLDRVELLTGMRMVFLPPQAPSTP